MRAKSSWLFFVASLVSQVAVSTVANASTFQLLHSFQGPTGDGSVNISGLVRDEAGNLYGTTEMGGSGTHCRVGRKRGCGTVFKITPDGTETVIYSFLGRPDGAFPNSGSLIIDADGNLVGTTTAGGRHTGHAGCGTIFKVTPSGSESVLHSFDCSRGGRIPESGVVEDKAGNLYGTTTWGGHTGCHGNDGCGVVYKLAANGTYAVLYSFTGGADGGIPSGALTLDEAGNLYGTTQTAGDLSCKSGLGCGTVFEISAGGAETTLHIFEGGTADGIQPLGGLLRDGAGDLYGTTIYGGIGNNGTGCGIVFKLAPDGTETILHTFAGGADGQAPYAGLTADGSGNLYGTTWLGGSSANYGYGLGTVYEITPGGTETVLHAFSGGAAGSLPAAPVTIGLDGTLYGTTQGTYLRKFGFGTVFAITP
jgi:uncharacterized repeat protein (TIGR03803 family)